MEHHTIRIDDIQIGGRRRAVSDEAVSRLKASIADVGLIQPISIRFVDEMVVDGDLTAGVPVLVAGAHRLAAVKALGWTHIDCIEVEDNDIAAELLEIAENLHRLDLTKEQRDEHIRRYAELLEVSRQNDAKPKTGPQGGRPVGVARQIATETGLSKRTVERALNPRPAARRVIEVPDQLSHDDMIQMQVRALMAAWNKAHPEARELFLQEVDAPVFDRSRVAA